MSKTYVTGPVYIYTQSAPANSWEFLGTAERYPKLLIKPHYQPIYNDVGGLAPYDVAFAGEEAFVIADINKFNEATYSRLAARPRVLAGRGFNADSRIAERGRNLPGDIGSLMMTEGLGYGLILQFPYALKPAYSDMPVGYFFACSYLAGPDELEPLGTTPRKIRMIWHCIRTFFPVTGILDLYTTNPVLFPVLPQPD